MQEQAPARYTEYAGHYARLWFPVLRPMTLRLLELVRLQGRHRILDIGCGPCGLASHIAREYPNAKLFGTDRESAMLRVAQSSREPIRLFVGDACRLGARDESFDAAIMSFMLFKTPDPCAALVEARRVLRPGGVVGATSWGGSTHALPDKDVWEDRLTDVPARTETDTTDQTNSCEKLRALCERAGFDDVSVECEEVVRTWTQEELMTLKTEFSYRDRLARLGTAERERRVAEIKSVLAKMSLDDLTWRAEILYAIASRRD